MKGIDCMIKKEEIKVVAVNKPTKKESLKKIEMLCEFLSKAWISKK